MGACQPAVEAPAAAHDALLDGPSCNRLPYTKAAPLASLVIAIDCRTLRLCFLLPLTFLCSYLCMCMYMLPISFLLCIVWCACGSLRGWCVLCLSLLACPPDPHGPRCPGHAPCSGAWSFLRTLTFYGLRLLFLFICYLLVLVLGSWWLLFVCFGFGVSRVEVVRLHSVHACTLVLLATRFLFYAADALVSAAHTRNTTPMSLSLPRSEASLMYIMYHASPRTLIVIEAEAPAGRRFEIQALGRRGDERRTSVWVAAVRLVARH